MIDWFIETFLSDGGGGAAMGAIAAAGQAGLASKMDEVDAETNDTISQINTKMANGTATPEDTQNIALGAQGAVDSAQIALTALSNGPQTEEEKKKTQQLSKDLTTISGVLGTLKEVKNPAEEGDKAKLSDALSKLAPIKYDRVKPNFDPSKSSDMIAWAIEEFIRNLIELIKLLINLMLYLGEKYANWKQEKAQKEEASASMDIKPATGEPPVEPPPQQPAGPQPEDQGQGQLKAEEDQPTPGEGEATVELGAAEPQAPAPATPDDAGQAGPATPDDAGQAGPATPDDAGQPAPATPDDAGQPAPAGQEVGDISKDDFLTLYQALKDNQGYLDANKDFIEKVLEKNAGMIQAALNEEVKQGNNNAKTEFGEFLGKSGIGKVDGIDVEPIAPTPSAAPKTVSFDDDDVIAAAPSQASTTPDPAAAGTTATAAAPSTPASGTQEPDQNATAAAPTAAATSPPAPSASDATAPPAPSAPATPTDTTGATATVSAPQAPGLDPMASAMTGTGPVVAADAVKGLEFMAADVQMSMGKGAPTMNARDQFMNTSTDDLLKDMDAAALNDTASPNARDKFLSASTDDLAKDMDAAIEFDDEKNSTAPKPSGLGR